MYSTVWKGEDYIVNDLCRLLKRLGIRRKYIMLLLLRSPFDALRTWMQADLLKAVFYCIETEDAGRLPGLCIWAGLLCAALFLYNGTIWGIYASFAARTEARLLKEMTDRIMSLPYNRVHGQRSGEWLTKLNSDIQATVAMMNGPLNIPHAVTAFVNTVLASVLMLKGSPGLLGLTWLFMLPHLLFNYRLVLKRLPALREESRYAMADVTSLVKPLVADAEAVWLYDAGGLLMHKCEEHSRRLMRTNLKMALRMGLSDMLSRLFGIGGYLAVLLTGLEMTRNGTMAFSDVVSCFQIRGAILAGMSMLIVSASNIKANSVSAMKVKHALER